MRLILCCLLFFSIGCRTKKVVPKEEKVKEEMVYVKSDNIVFCSKTYDLKNKLTFLNNVYQAFHLGDSSKLKAHLNSTVTISVQKGDLAENNFNNKSLSASSLNNWNGYLKDLCPEFGTSVCTAMNTTTADFLAETCTSDNGVKGKSYFRYIHFEKIKDQFYLKGIGLTIF